MGDDQKNQMFVGYKNYVINLLTASKKLEREVYWTLYAKQNFLETSGERYSNDKIMQKPERWLILVLKSKTV